jgi:hypothetical protein
LSSTLTSSFLGGVGTPHKKAHFVGLDSDFNSFVIVGIVNIFSQQ